MLHGEGWWRRAERFLAKAGRAAHGVTPLAGYRPIASERRRRADPHQRRDRHAGPRIRDGLRQTQPRLPAARPRRDGHRRPGLGRRRHRAHGSRGRSSTPAATCASTTPRPTSSAASRENAIGPAVLADACAAAGIRLLTFSSDQVFDGERGPALRRKRSRRRRSTSTARSKAVAERDVARALSAARWSCAPARSSAPGIEHNFVVHALRRAGARRGLRAAGRCPDLADLRARPGRRLPRPADRRRGRALAPRQRRRRQLGRVRGARGRRWQGFDNDVAPARREPPRSVAARPRYGVLASERALLMPTLDDALIARFAAEQQCDRAFAQTLRFAGSTKPCGTRRC